MRAWPEREMLAFLFVSADVVGPVVPVPLAESRAVAAIFVDACLKGAVRLDPATARIVPLKNLPDFADPVENGMRAVGSKVVKFDYPRATYLFVLDYNPQKTDRLSKVCEVVSRNINQNEAFQALMAGSGSTHPTPGYNWGRTWTIDARRQQGYIKRLTFSEDYSVALEMRSFAVAGASTTSAEH